MAMRIEANMFRHVDIGDDLDEDGEVEIEIVTETHGGTVAAYLWLDREKLLQLRRHLDVLLGRTD